MADNKSSLVQIAQAVLDEAEQAIKITGNIVIPPTTGVATEAKQDTQITELQAIKGYVDGVESKLDTLVVQTDSVETNLSSLDTKTPSLGQAVMANSVPVVIASNQPAINISGSVTANTGLLQPLTDSQLRATAVSISASSLPLPTGASTELTLLDVKTNTIKLDYVNRVRNIYAITNVTTGAWVELLSTIGVVSIKEIEIFDSSGETLELGIGVSGSETSKVFVFPGGNGRIPLQIPANSRLAIKAVSATANSGEICINLYG